MLWDTAGQEEFDAITKAYYRGAQACVLAFSMTDRDSFEAVHSWKLKVDNLILILHRIQVRNLFTKQFHMSTWSVRPQKKKLLNLNFILQL